MRTTENVKNRIGQNIEIKWGTSRGRDTYGYTTCTLYNGNGKRVCGCNGGGYDMRGTVVGMWAASAFRNELCKLKPETMEAHSHWEPERARVCAGKCHDEHTAAYEKWLMEAIEAGETDLDKKTGGPVEVKLPEDCFECPTCKGPTHASRDGKCVEDGRYFYGLSFHDPNFDPGKAVIGKGCSDRTLGDGAEGKTVEQAEATGESLGFERYQAFYKASSKHATKRHIIPQIDGACGFESVLRILNAVGVTLRKVHDSKKLDVYIVEKYRTKA